MFIAIARVSCASAESAPCDIAPVEKRRVISSTVSTSSTGIGAPCGHELEQVVELGHGPALDQVAEPLVELGALLGDRGLEQVRGAEVGRVGGRHRLGLVALEEDDLALVLDGGDLEPREPAVVALAAGTLGLRTVAVLVGVDRQPDASSAAG